MSQCSRGLETNCDEKFLILIFAEGWEFGGMQINFIPSLSVTGQSKTKKGVENDR